MGADKYKGIPKKFPALIDEDGNIAMDRPNPIQGGSGGFNPVSVGSGTLADGHYAIADTSIGYHTIVMLTAESGSGTADLNYTVDAVNQIVNVNGGAADARKFSYMLINPGLKSPKV